ncbi:uncharacterized protein DEA37_0010848 [Paragonimus westermani]|uniref:Reverse transcriptase RNase H-like domain-containing protein n=1 Tax=Paragonimus westermani TaxID=34504 RepID=A0A5J4N905_9TREM|nr:uncharacterized protein DEA37_0010848 [Paragonimus westermani]
MTLAEFQDVVAWKGGETGGTNLMQHRIDTSDANPTRLPPRRVPVHYQAELEKMISELVASGIICPSQSPWALLIVLVEKHDRTFVDIDLPCESVITETKQIAGSGSDPKSRDTDEAAVCARRAVRLARKRVGYEQLMGLNAVPADALIVATRFHPVDLTLLLMQFLPVGKPVVVYAQFLQVAFATLCWCFVVHIFKHTGF